MNAEPIFDAVLVRFPGAPDVVAPRYAEGLRRFAVEHPELRPHSVATMRAEHHPDALVVMLVWPAGVDHHILAASLLKSMRELGLERPVVEHFAVLDRGWDAVAGR